MQFKQIWIWILMVSAVNISLFGLFVQYIKLSHRISPGITRFKFNNKIWQKKTGECTPHKNIAFEKTHKCSSTTVQNILFRFGDRHSLDFVLPTTGHIIGVKTFFDKRFILDFSLAKYNILCQHARFNATAFSEVLPSDAMYITILRDPVEMFESGFTYFKLFHKSGLESFLHKPEFNYNQTRAGFFLKNPMLYDLGLKDTEQFYPNLIKKKISELEKQFDLVMITEYFEESLILLRHLLCWEIDDIVYFVHNKRSKSSVHAISPDIAKKILVWNAGDVELYDVFNKTFWQRVEDFGVERMKGEVKELRKRNQYFTDQCIGIKLKDNDPRVVRPGDVEINRFQLKDGASEKCRKMTLHECRYTRELRDIQLKRYNMTLHP